MSDENQSDKGLIKGIKEQAEKYLEKASQIKDKTQSMTDNITAKISDLKQVSDEYISTTKELSGSQLESIKSEARDIKKIFQTKDMIYKKTDAIAIVLRKLGKTDEFLQVVDKLTREGYRLVHKESIRDIPIAGGFSFPIGTFYFFQNIKYISIKD